MRTISLDRELPTFFWASELEQSCVIVKLGWIVACVAVLYGCATTGPTGQVVSFDRDALGHRPGPRGFQTVILDAGHGGRDSGAVSRTTRESEKTLALDTVKRIQKRLSGQVRVALMRGDDRFIELDERVNRASQRDGAILVSVHYNAGPPHLRGPETYWWRVDSFGLATRFQRAMERVSPHDGPNRGNVRRRLRLTRNPSVPSVLLELGYLSHPAEANLVRQAAYREKMAAAIADAILAQKREGDPAGTRLPRPINAPPSRPTDPPGS